MPWGSALAWWWVNIGTSVLQVSTSSVVEVVSHDVHEHEKSPVRLLRHRQQVAQGTVQGGEPGEGGTR